MTGPLKHFLILCAVLTALCLVLEGAAFQYDALCTRGLQPIALPEGTVETEELPADTDDITAVMPSAARQAPLYRVTVTWQDLSFRDIKTLRVRTEGTGGLARLQAYLRDGSYSLGWARADSTLALPGRDALLRLESHGTLTGVRISFETEDPEARAALAELNAPVPYRFSLLRFLVLLLPLLAVSAVVCFGLWRVLLRPDDIRHRAAYCLTALLCAALVLSVRFLSVPEDPSAFPYTRGLEYPFKNSVYQYRSLTHAVMFDMLAKGRVSVDEQPDPALLALDNPYDPTARMESGARVMFDYALYDGQYYCYFGMTPVLVYYAPFYLLTGWLPSYTSAACFFALLTVAAAFFCFWQAHRRFARGGSLTAVCLGAAAAALGSNILMLQSCADRYHLSIACMQAFFFLTVGLGFAAVRCRKDRPRAVLFVLCAVSTVLLAGSRITGALAAAGWLVPLFLLVLLGKKRSRRGRAADAACYLVPLCAGAAAVMAFNAARFGDPLEFGQTWQLTLEDIRFNRFTPGDILPALYSYYLEPLRFTSEFPFAAAGEGAVNHTGNWLYAVGGAGALTMPVTWGLACYPFLPEKGRRGRGAVLLTAAAVTVPLACMSFAVAGAAQRYVCDILPSLSLAGALLLAACADRGAREGRGAPAAGAAALCALTVLIACCLAFSNYRNFISQYAPERYLELYRLFTLR